MIHVGMGSPNLFMSLRACLHGGRGSQVGEVTHLGGVTCLSMYNLSFYLDYIYMIGGVTCQGRLPGLLGGVTLAARVTVCHVNVLRGVTHLAGVAFMAKSSKAKHVCFKNLYIS